MIDIQAIMGAAAGKLNGFGGAAGSLWTFFRSSSSLFLVSPPLCRRIPFRLRVVVILFGQTYDRGRLIIKFVWLCPESKY